MLLYKFYSRLGLLVVVAANETAMYVLLVVLLVVAVVVVVVMGLLPMFPIKYFWPIASRTSE